MLKDILLNTAANKVLGFLTLHQDASFYDKEVSEKTGVSRGMTNMILRQFFDVGLLEREKRGRMWFYTLSANPLFKYYRVYENLVDLENLVKALKPISQRVILFGSTAKGEDTAESDIDLFILATRKDEALKAIREYDIEREIKLVLQTPSEYAVSRKKDKAFYDEVAKGIVLFNKEPDEQRL
ncbi:MAG: nucleotidyltransferase domain-containing protein [Candidatus Aquicultor sp.]|nr:nucleotidyltransferase domain-containing protein [Candidatus Aquicultor sp.]